MNKHPLISVIIPLYNTEKYIESCIRSVLNQTYQHFEIIVINDGSKDKSGEIVFSLSQQDARIRLINKENGGVSAARNDGIRAANGELIAFLDSDDEYLPNAFEDMLAAMDDETDLLIASHRKIWIKTHDERYTNESVTIEELRSRFTELKPKITFIWGNLYRSEIIKENRILFNDNIQFSEDFDFNLRYINNIKRKIRFSDTIIYNYYISRSGSHAKIDTPVKDLTMIEAFFGGKENMDKDIYRDLVGRYLVRCVNRNLSWYSAKQTAENVKVAFEDCSDYLTDEILFASFTERQAKLLLAKDYKGFTKDYYKNNPKKLVEKYRFFASKTVVRILQAMHKI